MKKNVSRIVLCHNYKRSTTNDSAGLHIPLQHIRKGVVLRWNIVSDLRDTAVDCQQFRNESRKRPKRIILELNYT